MIEVLEAELEHARLATDSSLYWTPDRTAVSNLTFTARRHEVTLVSGPVGSGKSSLLEAMLGELDLVSGRATAKAGCLVAYAPQTPTILAATVRANVLFGERVAARLPTAALGRPHQTSDLPSSVESKSIRLSFGGIGRSRRVLEGRTQEFGRNRVRAR